MIYGGSSQPYRAVASGCDRFFSRHTRSGGRYGLQMMTQSIETKVAEPSDLEGLVELHLGFRDSLQRTVPSAGSFRQGIAKLFAMTDGRQYIAYCEGRAAGYAFQRFLYSAWSQGEESILDELFVKEEFRGRGIARQLVELAIRDAKGRGCKAMSLDTNENNFASNPLYLSLGFTCERARWNGGRQIRYDLKLT